MSQYLPSTQFATTSALADRKHRFECRRFRNSRRGAWVEGRDRRQDPGPGDESNQGRVTGGQAPPGVDEEHTQHDDRLKHEPGAGGESDAPLWRIPMEARMSGAA